MGSSNHYYFMYLEIIVVVVVVATLCLADDAYISTRATYYGSPYCNGNPTGACGFGEFGRSVNNGVVSGVSRLYRNGTGCGACYQVRCKISAHCSDEGTQVVVTDYGEGDNTDFILSARAYATLAKPNMAAELFAYGVVDVDYRRIPCRYGYNLKITVHERSNFPHYLAILAIYESGMYDITAVRIWEEEYKEWKDMRRVYGAVWDVQNPSITATILLSVQLVGRASADFKWAQLAGVIATDWKPQVVYDAAIQLN